MTTTEINTVEDYLRFEVESFDKLKIRRPDGFHYVSQADLVLREGRAMEYGSTRLNGPIKECYGNAYKAVSVNPDLTYCEGYVMGEDMPLAIPHAWVLDTDGTVIETTLRRSAEGVEFSYYGIALDTDFVTDVIAETGYVGVLDDWRRDFELYRQPLPAEARAEFDLADHDLFKCDGCGEVKDNDDSVRGDDGFMFCVVCMAPRSEK